MTPSAVLPTFGFALVLQAGAPSPEDALARGDEAYARFDNAEALRLYEAAVAASLKNAEAWWRLARAHSDLGKAAEPGDEDAARSHYRRGEEAARRAVALDPESAHAHFLLAVTVGRLALFEGGKTKIRLSLEVKAEAERALEIDPTHDGAWHVLGRWNYGIATLSWVQKAFARIIYGGVPPGASVERAALMFERAIEHDPSRPMHHLEHARALVKLGRLEEARAALRRCLDLPRVQWDDPEIQAEAAEMLREAQGRR